MNENNLTFQEAYGHMPKALWTLIKRHNVTPADYMMMCLSFGEDYARLADFITGNLIGKSFNYPFGV